MLASSGRSLILYQAYDNLCAMTGRKAYLLEDKQIPSVGVFDDVFLALRWHLEEINVTWAHLEKKRTRLRTYTKSLEELCKQCMETASLASNDISQLRRNLEAYVDNMVIKSSDKKILIADITEMFNNLGKINMKLNLKKCSFRMEEKKFIGYMVTTEGIREIVDLYARVETLKQYDRVTQDLLRVARGRTTQLQLRAMVAEQQAGDRVRIQTAEMIEQDVKALRARAEAAKQRAEALQISLKAAPNRYHRFARVPSMPPKEQPLSQEDIKKLIDQRVTDAIEAIATKQKPAWITTQWIGSYVRELRLEGDHGESSNQQTNKRYEMIRAYAVEPSNKKE
nr:reverse transcriptase domain-containing protein [Tanacetum cinerariifolium]